MNLLYTVDKGITVTRFSLMWQYLDVTHLQILECRRVSRSITFVLIITDSLCTAHISRQNILHVKLVTIVQETGM
jgi:hypothetical protein